LPHEEISTLQRQHGKCDDRLKKLCPLVDKLRDRFKTVPLEENLSVDEQMTPFKGRHRRKQYLPKKPHKWGYKAFVLWCQWLRIRY